MPTSFKVSDSGSSTGESDTDSDDDHDLSAYEKAIMKQREENRRLQKKGNYTQGKHV